MRGVLATGIDFGPDGALYLADWIDGWDTKDYGRIWKLDVAGGPDEMRKQVKAILGDDFKKYDESKLSDLLKHPDMRVRQKSQLELATRGESGLKVFQENVDQRDNQLARVHSIWGISQFARKDIKHAQLLVTLLKDSDPEIRAQAAKWIGDVRYKDAGDVLLPLLKDDYSRARFFAAEALGRISFEPAINPLIELLRDNNDEDHYIRHAASLALARIGKPEPVIALAKDPSRAVRIAAVVALRRMKHPDVAIFLNDTDELIVTEAARAINDDLSIEAALPALGDVLLNYRLKNEALIRRAINANLRVGTEKSMQNLIEYSMHEGSPVSMRSEALAALSTWAKPSVLDRVDGRFRGVISRDPEQVKAKSTEMLVRLTGNQDAQIRLSAVKAIGKLSIEEAAPRLFTLLKSDPKPDIRSESLKSLALLNDKQIGVAIKQALSDNEKSVRVVGLDLLPKMDLPKDLMVTLLNDVINTRTTEEKQAAITTLGSIPIEFSQPVFDDLLSRMEGGKLPPEIYLELSDAIDSTKSMQLIDRYKAISKLQSPDSLKAIYAGSLLGGDANRGARIFYSNQTAQCIRCHSYGDYGGTAGPRLNGVAARLSREQLLEALIDPSARIAPGFGTVSLELTSGKKINGVLQQENSKGLLVKVGDKPDTLINKENIAKRTDGMSSMPPMRYLLSKKELRDVVSFLATMKEGD